ncbi:hypothetical protein KJ359_009380 [Pestalotiopsis sp. 9143b]|nr:hypothetical protein KJ359_009380 [Pestalotiopsis sp. 9143b]
MTDPDLIAFTLDQLKGPEYPSISIENFFHDLLERESGHGFVELLSKFADNKAFHENVSSALRNKPEILFQGYRKAIQKAQAMDCLSESALAHLRYYYAIALLYPRKATGGCCEVSVSRAIDGTKQRDKNISQARKALQTSIRRWIDQKRPREYEEVILGKTTRALGFAYVEWARTKPKSNGRIPKLESLKRQQDELLNEQDQRFSILVARTYRHLGQHSLVKQHTRELIQTAFNLLDDGLPDNDWSGYDLLAQALATLDKRDDASAAWFLVSHSIEGDDLGENDDANDKNDSLGRVESDAAAWTDDDTTDRMVGFDGDSDEDEDEDDLDPDLGDSQDPERQSDEPKRLRNGVFFECDGNCGFSWQGRIEQDMYLCMDCANVRLDHACYESLKSGCLARRICSLDHEFLPVEKWTKERSMAVGRDKVQVGDETVSIQSWLDEIRKDYLSGEPAQEDIYSGKGEKIMVE